MANVVTSIHYGTERGGGLASTVPGFNTERRDRRSGPTNGEVVATIHDQGDGLPDGTYTVSSSTRAAKPSGPGQDGLANKYGTPLNTTGINPDGSDFESRLRSVPRQTRDQRNARNYPD